MLKLLVSLFFLFLVSVIGFKVQNTTPWRKDFGCENYDNENSCQGRQTDNNASWSSRSFQTPPRNHSLWRESYQDYNILVGYPKVTYNPHKTSALIEVQTRVNPKYQNFDLKYYFNGTLQTSPAFNVSLLSGLL